MKESAKRVLDRPEFRHLRRTDDAAPQSGDITADAPDEVEDDPVRVPRGGGAAELLGAVVGPLFAGLAYALLLAVAGVIGYLAFLALKNWGGRDRDRVGEPGNVAVEEEEAAPRPADTPADLALAEARRLAAAGRYAEAVAVLWDGLTGVVERRGLIRHRRGLTAGDYLTAGRRDAALSPALRAVLGIHEPIGYGRRPATPALWDAAVGHYERAATNPAGTPPSDRHDARGDG